MRGNRLVKGGDPMKTRSQKRKERREKIARSGRAIRLKKRLGRIAAKNFAQQGDTHTTALMESYILRRKAERTAEKEKQKAAERLANGEEEEEDMEEEEEDDVSSEEIDTSHMTRKERRALKFGPGSETGNIPGRTYSNDSKKKPQQQTRGGAKGKYQGKGQQQHRQGGNSNGSQQSYKGGRGGNRDSKRAPLQSSKRVTTKSLY